MKKLLQKVSFRALKSRTYFLVFELFHNIHEYYKVFYKSGFSVPHPYFINSVEDSIGGRPLDESTQKCVSYIIICRKNGEYLSGSCMSLR